MKNESQIAINLIIHIIDQEIKLIEDAIITYSGDLKYTSNEEAKMLLAENQGARDALLKLKADFVFASSS